MNKLINPLYQQVRITEHLSSACLHSVPAMLGLVKAAPASRFG